MYECVWKWSIMVVGEEKVVEQSEQVMDIELSQLCLDDD